MKTLVRQLAERTAQRLWAGELGVRGRLLSIGLLPFAGLWKGVTWVRSRRFARATPTRVDGLRVVSIGSLAAGGTGKTPFASWSAGVLADGGASVAILRRDYGHDETLLHRQWRPDIPVVQDADRVRAAVEARAAGADYGVLDDGFQHRWLARDVDIVILAVEDRFPGALLPRGPYREPVSALQRAHVVVLTRRTATIEAAERLASRVHALKGTDAGLVKGCVHLAPGRLRPLLGPSDPGPDAPPTLLESPVVLTAVARPGAVLRDVASMCTGRSELIAYPDHHDFTEADVRRARVRAGAGPIVVTEKDAVKLRSVSAMPPNTWVLEQRLDWDWGRDEVRGLLENILAGAPR